MDLCQIYREDLFGPSLRWVNVKVKVTREKNAMCTPITPSSDGMECVRCIERHVAVVGATPSLPVGDVSGLHVVCVW